VSDGVRRAGGPRWPAKAPPPDRHQAGPPDRHEPPSPNIELCAFRVGDEEYAIDLRRIREILQPLPITPVPRAPEYVDGVMNLRGEVIPVVDVRKRLGLTPRAGGRAKVLVVTVAGRVLGLVVDAVSEVVRLPRSAIGPPPPLLAETGPRLFLGVCGAREVRSTPGARHAPAQAGRAPPRLRLLLNVKALLEPATPAAASAARLSARTPGA
jgi:purine-binding chemotaxis protein CheW